MHTYMPPNSIFDGPITSLLLILCILIEVLSRAHATSKKSLNDFRFGAFIGHFPSDGTVSMAVKGLTMMMVVTADTSTVFSGSRQGSGEGNG